MNFLMFLFGGIGLTSIVVDSEFFSGWKENFGKKIKGRTERLGDDLALKDRKLWWMKKIYYLLNCYQCSGFWIGFVLGALMHPLGEVSPGWWRIMEAVVAGGVISYTAQVGMALYNYLNVQWGSTQ